jgi:NitT/TauT family transport system substrate-binding protein
MPARSRSDFLVAASALALAAGVPARAQAPAPVLRVGMGPSDAYGEAWYAADAGIFQKAGLNVEVQAFNSGNTATSAVVAGTLDIVGTTPVPIANAVIRGIPLVIVAAAAVNTVKAPQAVMCVRKDGPIHSAKDLAGKTVGMNVVRSIPELGLDMWLAKNDVDIAHVRTVEVLAAEMGPAVERGTIDAFVAGEPALSAALRANNVRVLVDPMSYIAPRFMFAGWFTSAQFAQRNPELLKRFANTIYETARWANRHHTETAQILAKYTKLNVADVTTMVRADFSEELRLNELQPLLDAAAKFNFLPRQISAAEFVAKS